MKWVFRIVGVLVLLVIVAVVALYFALNPIVKNAVQTAGSSATGVETTLAGVNLSPFSGAATLNDFALAQPEGFTEGNIFRLGAADVQVETGSLLGDTIQVPKVHIDGAHLTVAFENGKLNLTELMKQIQENTSTGTETEPETEPDAPAEDGGEAKHVVIEDLRITNTKVTGSIGLIPGQAPIAVDLQIADIHKTGIGSDGTGLTLDDAIGLILETIMLNATEDIAARVPGLGDLHNMVGDLGGQATELIGGLGGDATGTIDDAAGQATKAIDGVGQQLEEGLGGLFGGKKKDNDAE